MSKPSEDALHASPLIEFLSALPSPLTITLVGLAPSIAKARYVIQLMTWKAPWEDCCLLLALWWALCMIPEFGLSAYFRWATYRAWSILSGQPLPPKLVSPQSLSDASIASLSSSEPGALSAGAPPSPGSSIRFLFTIYENQRWWMGLDWTAALLPGERPSWCTASQQPVAPPSAFTLPAPTTVYTLAPDGKRRLKRTARWTWEEPEWRVVVRRDGAATSSRVEKPLPVPKEESAAAASASRILKAAGKMRQPSMDAGRADGHKDGDKAAEKEDGASTHGDLGVGPARLDAEEDDEPYTDPDGWVYADNKWEGPSSKGGMGKYTRYRRWTRVAVLTETVELVGPGELGIQREQQTSLQDATVSTKPVDASASPSAATAHENERTSPEGTAKPGPEPQDAALGVIVQPGEDEGSRLRQRLKAAVKGATGH
ncbi:hypothetical protein BN946_scf184969.g52 [Trametes cinnabarina]|uniref:Peroxin/Ferlin domain-containing protein n=1 Tax=Pycnoporus cinnabarinus TaxID=5643 RepID=A0A060SU88_PYCCI|nr:hypothetical protein BN946_scf184969.g52 [Trametes cinnabarina]